MTRVERLGGKIQRPTVDVLSSHIRPIVFIKPIRPLHHRNDSVDGLYKVINNAKEFMHKQGHTHRRTSRFQAARRIGPSAWCVVVDGGFDYYRGIRRR